MTIPRRTLPAWLALLLFVSAACGEAPATPAASTAGTVPHPSASAAAAAATPSPSATTEAGASAAGVVISAAPCVKQTLASMSEAQRIGQLFMLRLPDDVLDSGHLAAINAYHLGNVWYERSTAGVTALRSVSDAVQHAATSAATAGVPFLIGANQEGGLIQGLSGPGFSTIPSAVAQGKLEPAQLQTLAESWARQLRKAGVNVDFAPVADVVPPGTSDQNAPIGQLDREYGTHPGTVARHVVAFIDGMRTGGVATTAKHFPGLGRVAGNTDHTANVVDNVTTTDDPYLRPFQHAVDASVPFVMISLATYRRIDPTSIAAFSPIVIKGLLRKTLGFTGVVMSDSLTAEAVKAVSPRQRALRFLAAGGDLIVLSRLQPAIKMATGLADAAANDPAMRSTIDAAARKVLRAKADAGLLACG